MSNSIPQFSTHICFVSQQPVPNLMLAMNPDSKPKKIYLLSSQDMLDKGIAKNLQNMFKKVSVAAEIVPLQSLSFFSMKGYLNNFLNALYEKEDISQYAFNLTGGTKPMSLAAFDACRELGMPMFYVDTFNKNLMLLHEEKEYTLTNFLSVLNILNSYGYQRIKTEKQYSNNYEIIKKFLDPKYKISISNLNFYSAKALEDNQFSTTLNSNCHPLFIKLLDECQKAGLLERHENTLLFKDEQARSFCNGIWLEEYVQHTLEQLKITGNISDFETSINVEYSDTKKQNTEKKPVNECDALFVANNILHVIECKTQNFESQYSENENKPRNIFYKLDSLTKNIGGSFAQGILISFYKVPDAAKEHAQKNNITIIDTQAEIVNLQKTLKAYLKK